MNERYLFRGKICGQDEWKIGAPWQNGDQVTINGVFVIPSTVGQCTGLCDNNGQLIFEGDIIKAPDGELGVIGWNDAYDQHGHYQDCGFIVKFDGQQRWRGDLLFWVFDKDKDREQCSGTGVEVIGNIYENQELINNANI